MKETEKSLSGLILVENIIELRERLNNRPLSDQLLIFNRPSTDIQWMFNDFQNIVEFLNSIENESPSKKYTMPEKKVAQAIGYCWADTRTKGEAELLANLLRDLLGFYTKKYNVQEYASGETLEGFPEAYMETYKLLCMVDHFVDHGWIKAF